MVLATIFHWHESGPKENLDREDEEILEATRDMLKPWTFLEGWFYFSLIYGVLILARLLHITQTRPFSNEQCWLLHILPGAYSCLFTIKAIMLCSKILATPAKYTNLMQNNVKADLIDSI